jgi:protein-disulfide isomerase
VRTLSSLLTLALALALAPACRPRGEAAAPAASAAVTAGPSPVLPPSRVAEVWGDDELDPSASQQAAGIPYLRFFVPVGDAPRRGPDDAPVTIVMFSDFECPYCAVGSEIVRTLEADYPGKIRFVYKAFPIDRHPNALLAALVAHSALEQGRFWPLFDLLFGGASLDPEVIGEYAVAVGLDMARVEADLDSLRHAPAVKRDLRQAERLAVRSTPTFFVNGRHIKGAQPVEAFRMLIDQELALAAEWNAAGVSAAGVYDHATRHGWTEIVRKDARPRLDDSLVFPVPLGTSPRKGPSEAEITIVSFGDFQCPYCARGLSTLDALEDRLPGQIRFVYKQFPLPGHPHARLAARASLAAHAQGKFWAFHDELYARGARFRPDDLELIAMQLGLDMARFRQDLASERFDAEIDEDVRLGTSLGVDGTPTYFVNGRPLGGARSELEFRMLIAEERERVARLRAKGVVPARLYETLTGEPGLPGAPAR